MKLRFQGDDEVLKFTVKMVDANILELWENPESWLRLIRRGEATETPSARRMPESRTSRPADQSPANLPTESSKTIADAGRPQCPQGWTDFKNPLIGMQACVPGDYWVRLRGGMTLTSASQGRLDQEMSTLKKIARSFGFVPPLGRWIDYKSPAGGFTIKIPESWLVQSNDGQTHKDDIDWVVFDQKTPSSRVFQWCPRYCSPQLLQDPLHAMRGYQAAQFQNHEQVVTTSLG
ncbi:MAG: hypothetical protein V2B20_17610 [Pseudomonadota bacterium]